MTKYFDVIALLLYCGLIFWLSNQPWLPIPNLIENQDKFHHFAAYFMMGILAWRAFCHFITDKAILAVTCVVFCSLYGVTDEWHQAFVPGRQSDILDWLADTTGSILSTLFVKLFIAVKAKNSINRGKTL